MAGDYYPTGPFLRKRARGDVFELAREDFLLGFHERTARAYKADLEDFREWCEAAGIDPLAPSPDDVERYQLGLKERGYAPGTINRRMAAVRGFLRIVSRARSTATVRPAPVEEDLAEELRTINMLRKTFGEQTVIKVVKGEGETSDVLEISPP